MVEIIHRVKMRATTMQVFHALLERSALGALGLDGDEVNARER